MAEPEMMDVQKLLEALAILASKICGSAYTPKPVKVLRREAVAATTGYQISSRLGGATIFEFESTPLFYLVVHERAGEKTYQAFKSKSQAEVAYHQTVEDLLEEKREIENRLRGQVVQLKTPYGVLKTKPAAKFGEDLRCHAKLGCGHTSPVPLPIEPLKDDVLVEVFNPLREGGRDVVVREARVYCEECSEDSIILAILTLDDELHKASEEAIKLFRNDLKRRLFERFAFENSRSSNLEEEFWKDRRVEWEAFKLAGEAAEAWIREHRRE